MTLTSRNVAIPSGLQLTERGLGPANRHSRRSGIALIWAAIVMFILVGFVGLASDTAYVLLVGHQLQNCADASSLAAAMALKSDIVTARQEGVDIGLANSAARQPVQLDHNPANAPTGDIVVGRFESSTQTFTPQLTEVNAVRVVARRTDTSLGGPLPLLFGPIFGVVQSNVARDATAIVGGGQGGGIIALDRSASCAFDVRGASGSLIVNDGVIQVNSDHPTAACHAGQPTVVASELLVAGSTDRNFDAVDFTGELYTDRDPIEDPLAWLPEPVYDPADDLGGIVVDGGAVEHAVPGYYAQGFTIRNGRLNVAPGVYILGGPGLDDNGGDLIAHGVMFYIVDDGSVDLRGNGVIEMSPPDLDAYAYPAGPDVTPYADAGVTIFLARDNTSSSRMLGTSQFSVAGTVYIPDGHLEIGGTSNSFTNGIIANTIEAHGDGELVIDYDGRFPPVPRFVYLVE